MPGFPAGTSAYWSVIHNGSDSTPLNEVDGVFTPFETATVTVLVDGNTYQAFKDPDGVFDANSVLLTTLVDNTFSHGQFALYDTDAAMSFGNIAVSGSLVSGAVPEPSTWSMMLIGLSDGRLFVFNSLQNWLSEFRIYRRDEKGKDEKGKIVKQNDHLMDATRYLIMSGLEVACREPREEDDDNRQWIDSTRNEYTGY